MRGGRRRAGREVAAVALAGLVGVAALLALAGCSRRAPSARTAPPAPPPDTLFIRITPLLSNWLSLWRYADPEIAADSLVRASEAPFTMRDIHHHDALAPSARVRTNQLGFWSPDSLRVVVPDTAVFVADGFLKHAPEDAPAAATVLDLQISSMATIDTCTACELDGAFWDGNERFALTGTAVADSAGARRGFVRYFDLTSGAVTEYDTRAVTELSWRRYVVARELARAARLHAAAP